MKLQKYIGKDATIQTGQMVNNKEFRPYCKCDICGTILPSGIKNFVCFGGDLHACRKENCISVLQSKTETKKFLFNEDEYFNTQYEKFIAAGFGKEEAKDYAKVDLIRKLKKLKPIKAKISCWTPEKRRIQSEKMRRMWQLRKGV